VPGYEVQTAVMHIGAYDYLVRSLADRRQYADPDGRAERAGIPPASWPMFGVIWPAGHALALEMDGLTVAGMRILEVGCGIGLASLVLRRRGADITASDHHPLAEEFMRHNTDLNGLGPIAYLHAPWGAINSSLGLFDLIIGSDVLYERDHPALLAGFIDRHAARTARVIIADPGRKHCGRFNARMAALGYERSERRISFPGSDNPASLGRLMSFARASA